MLIRIGLIIAIIGALAAGVVNFVVIKDKVTALKAHDDEETKEHAKYLKQYTDTKRDLDKTNAVLKTTIETLNATQEAKDKAVAEADAQTKRATKLAEDLSKTQGERDDAQRELAAYRAIGLPPDQIKVINDQNKSLVR